MTEQHPFTEELLAICASGPLDKLKALLRQDACAENIRNRRGHTALQVALRHGQWEIARFLHRRYPALSQKSTQQLPLVLAASQYKKDDPQGLELASSLCADDIDATNTQGRSALLTASLLGHLKKVKWLLARGAAVNHQDNSGRSALMEATEINHVGLVRALLKAGANPNLTDQHGANTILCVMRHKKPSLTIVKMLLASGADPEHRDKHRHNAWLLAKEKNHAALELIEKHINHTRQIELPLFDHANHHTPAENSTHPKPTASTEDNVPRHKHNDDASCYSPKTKMERKQHQHPGDPDLAEWFTAASSGNLGKIQRLLLGGMDINATDQHGCTALIRTIGTGRRAAVAFLLNRGADVNHASHNGSTALSAAILSHQPYITRLLLAKGANTDIPGPDRMPLTLLAAAVWSEEQLLALEAHGANLHARDRRGRTALHAAALACESNHNLPAGKATFQFLLGKKLDVLQKDNTGHTALELLCGAHKNKLYQARDSHIATLLHSILQCPALPMLPDSLLVKLAALCSRHGLANARGVILARRS